MKVSSLLPDEAVASQVDGGTCRLCLRTRNRLTTIFAEGETSRRLRSRILDCCPVEVSVASRLSIRATYPGLHLFFFSNPIAPARRGYQATEYDLPRLRGEGCRHVRISGAVQANGADPAPLLRKLLRDPGPEQPSGERGRRMHESEPRSERGGRRSSTGKQQ